MTDPKIKRRKFWPVIMMLVMGLSATWFGSHYAKDVETDRVQRRFELRVEETETAIANRFAAYQQVLRGGVALFNASREVDRNEWRSYVAALKTEDSFPGIQGIGFALQLQDGELEQHTASVRAEGFPDYQVHPLTGDRPPTTILFLEPFDFRNQRAFGYDMYSEKTRRAAMSRARDTGEPALSGRVTLLQETESDQQAGTLLYLPVYRANVNDSFLTDRRQHLLGWVYSPFRMNDLMEGILGEDLANIRLRIYDDGVREQTHLLFDNVGNSREGVDLEHLEHLSASFTLNVGGRDWLVALETLPGFIQTDITNAQLVAVAGILLTLMLAMVAASISGSETRAQHLAKEKTLALAESERKQRAIVENTADGIVTFDSEGRILSVNRAAAIMFGYLPGELPGQPVVRVLPEFRLELCTGKLEDGSDSDQGRCQMVGGDSIRLDLMGHRQDTSSFPVRLAVNSIKRGEDCEFVALLTDQTERENFQRRLQHMAHHDALTELPNRALLKDRMDQAILKMRRDQGMAAVMLLDLDHFKRINDSLGHHIGDELLLEVSKRLKTSVRELDTVARMGGDEFVVLLPSVSSQQAVGLVAQKLLVELSAPYDIAGRELVITPSIGIAIYPQDGQSEIELLKKADAAMYEAKNSGRGRMRFFDRRMLEDNHRRLELETALRRAIEKNELRLMYQKQVSLETGELIGCEALLRWQHPVLGNVPPDQFVPIAEDLGIIEDIGRWVINTACMEIRQMQVELEQEFTVAVNVSPRQFFHGDIVAMVERALSLSGLPPQCLELELTEGVLIENPSETVETLRRFRAMGVKVSIDDFGTGYSSLSYLMRYPIDNLKIDRSFINDLTLDSQDAALTGAIIAMAHSLGLSVIAEGVETIEQGEFLRRHHCDVVQGFYFGRPVSKEDFIKQVDDSSAYRSLLLNQFGGQRWANQRGTIN